MSRLLRITLATALGFVVSTPLYAQSQSAALSDADARTALSTCDSLAGTQQARCIVNIRPTAALAVAQTSPEGNTVNHAADGTTVKDGTALTEAEYAAAVKECESAEPASKDRCVTTAKEHFGRM